MLRSVLVAAFSAVVAFGALTGLSGGNSEPQHDTAWSAAAGGDDDASVYPADTAWS
ncbi:hypothetical protein [Streptomyces sp. NBC_00582]|uniref:hypothetical protein n=1 Tax=Streptomyces sp. NBC_00582 TaxID=2975783 RepID=UPI0010ED9468|nr:hypothetical protein [Streptomyces sp. NBC_00582]WUB63055.1 hypothetical protein OG852_22925 [Streptomyces sp. NBC_00582]